MDQLLRTALAQRLAQHLQSQVEPLGGLLRPQEDDALGRIGSGLRAGTALPKALIDALGLAREGLDYGAKAATGGLLAANSKVNPFLRLFPDSPGANLAEQALAGYENARTGNPIGRMREANEAGAAGNEIAVGLLNQATNPLSYVTGGGSAAAQAAARGQRAASGLNLSLNAVNQLLYPEGGALAALGGKAIEKVGAPLARQALTALLRNRHPLPLDVGPQEFAEYAGKQMLPLDEAGRSGAFPDQFTGIPVPDKIDLEASDLAPEGQVSWRKLLAQAIADNPRTKGIAARIGSGLPPNVMSEEDAGGVLRNWLKEIPETPNAPALDIERDYQKRLAADIIQGPSEALASKVPGIQGVEELVGAGQRSARPNPLEALLGAARGTAGRNLPTPEPPTSGQLPLLASPSSPGLPPREGLFGNPTITTLTGQLPLAVREPLDLMRDLLRSGDGGKGMVYAPRDPQFWNRRTGVDPTLVPDLLNQLRGEGALRDDRYGELINTLLTGGDRAAPAPDVPAEVLTGPLTSAELGTLVNFAYPHPKAQENARKAYADPADLAEAALNRIGQTPDTIQTFASNHPALAQRLVDLPDPRLGTLDELPPAGFTGHLGDRPIPPAPLPEPEPPAPGSLAALKAEYDRLAQEWAAAPLVDRQTLSGPYRAARAAYEAATQQGGDNLGLLPALPSRLAVAGSGATLGGTLGGLAPADDAEDRRRNMLTGAGLGAGAGLGISSAAAVPALSRITNTAGKLVKEAGAAQVAAMNRPSLGVAGLAKLPQYWAVQTTEHVKNLLQSPATSALWLKNAGVRISEMGKNYASMVDLHNLGVKNPYDAQPAQTTAILDAIGLTGHIMEGGKSFASVNGDIVKTLSAKDMALQSGLLGTLNPLYGGIPGAGLALGVGIGYGRAFLHSIYQALDNFAEQAARHAAFQDEIVPLLKVAAADFLQRNGLSGALTPDGLFSGADVAALAGQAAGDEWTTLSKKVVALSEKRARDILGDFSKRGGAETALGTAIPFIGWAVRAYPRTAKMMLDHPGIALILTMVMFNAAEGDLKEGVPGYQVGNVAIQQDTPALGGIAKALTGGQPGEMRVNLLSGLSPIGGSVLAEDDLPDDATGYQQGRAALSRVGFAPSPIIQALAYGLNKDFQKPGALSRTAGVETLVGRGGPEVPSLAAGPLNALRVAAGGSAQTATPHDRKLAEVYFRLTGFPISDPSNMQNPQRRALLLDTLNPDSEIRQQADREMAISGGTKTALSLTSPLTATPRTDIQQQQQQTRQDMEALPAARYTPQQIAAMRQSKGIHAQIEAYLMGRANRGTQGDIPDILQVTRGASGGERGQDILAGLLPSGSSYYERYLLQDLLGIQPQR